MNSSDEEASDEEETANLCLVARKADSSDSENEEPEVTLSELQEVYNELLREFRKVVKSNVSMRKQNKLLEETVETLSKELSEAKQLPETQKEVIKGSQQVEPEIPVSQSCVNCDKLTIENDKLSRALQKFTKGSETLNIILMNQRVFKDRTGLGYQEKAKSRNQPKIKPYLKFFRKSSEYASPYSFCNFCNRKGHTQSTCNARKYGVTGSYKWVKKGTHITKTYPSPGDQGNTTRYHQPNAHSRPKAQHVNKPKVRPAPRGTETNFRGPKKVWVPKFV